MKLSKMLRYYHVITFEILIKSVTNQGNLNCLELEKEELLIVSVKK